MRHLGKCYRITKNKIHIRNLKGEEFTTDREELADLGERYTYSEIGDEFGVCGLTMWRLFRDTGVKKKYIRRYA